ncbi:uncharacterized protein FFNC_15694 [Fusarium fujikuroi]|nr:uncharacterized protein FFNC_15694 [Fusarium fujikuroi]
MTAIKKAA